jgi:phosphatidylglycerophosphate synthase
MTEQAYQPTERRPIQSREKRWSKAVAHWLATHGVSPNAISIAGMLACAAAGVALALTPRVESTIAERALWLAAAVLVPLRLLGNMFDGMVAVETGRASPVGELYNEIPDRVADFATLAGLGYAAGGSSPTLGYLAASLAIFTAYVRAQGKAAGARSEFCGPMAKQHRMMVVTAVALFMAVAPAVWRVRIGDAVSGGWGIPALALLVINVGCVVTVWRRLARIAWTLRGGAAA